jgi:hypothetical protein
MGPESTDERVAVFREHVRDSFIDYDRAALAVAWPFGVGVVLPVILILIG